MKDLTVWLEEPTIAIPGFLIGHYKEMGLNEVELMLYLHLLYFHQIGNQFPTPTELCGRMAVSESDCFEALQSLLKHGFITLSKITNEDGISYEVYDLSPLNEKMAFAFMKKQQQKRLIQSEETEKGLYRLFEQEFARPLSPIEGELISQWIDIDHYSPTMIKAALKEAVISSVLNFRYIERILYDWKQKGIETPEQAAEQGEKVRRNAHHGHSEIEERTPAKDLPLYNWLKD